MYDIDSKCNMDKKWVRACINLSIDDREFIQENCFILTKIARSGIKQMRGKIS